jgi:hypothetical protein
MLLQTDINSQMLLVIRFCSEQVLWQLSTIICRIVAVETGKSQHPENATFPKSL